MIKVLFAGFLIYSLTLNALAREDGQTPVVYAPTETAADQCNYHCDSPKLQGTLGETDAGTRQSRVRSILAGAPDPNTSQGESNK